MRSRYTIATRSGQRMMLLAVMVGLSIGSGDAGGQVRDELRRRLDASQSELDENRRQRETLERGIAEAQAERERLSRNLLETARLIQNSEARLSEIEGRQAKLGEEETALRERLMQQHGKIAVLLGAMQRMGRNPPPVMVTRREDALKMVRSAMLLARAFPELSEQAHALAGRLTTLAAVMAQIKAESENLRAETQRHEEQRTRIAGLLEERRSSLARFQPELEAARKRASEAARRIEDLGALIARLDSESVRVTPAVPRPEPAQREPGSGRVPAGGEAERPAPSEPAPPVAGEQAAPPPPAGRPAPPREVAGQPGVAPAPATGSPPARPEPAVAAPPGVVAELAPTGTRVAGLSPGLLKPSMSFAQARGRLPMPAQGRRVLSFGERTQYGGQSHGIVIETRHSAQVVSPCDGWILFAGEFRSFGQLLIINGDDGYHVLLAGLSQIDVQVGQFVLAGEPVGLMSAPPRAQGPGPAANAPVLYVEFRKDNRPINPDPWWTARSQRVQG